MEPTAKIRANWYEKHGISKKRYCELLWFARQYDDYKAADRRWRNGEYDRMATGNTAARGHSDPTAGEAIRIASSPCAWKIAVIEQAAIAAAPEICKELLRNVVRDETWETIGAPCGRKQFYEARRKFYLELHLILENR